MKKLIFDTEIRGHHLEFIHHIYRGAVEDIDNSYIFAVPDSFKQYKKQYEWPKVPNICFYFIPESVINKCRMKNKASYLYESLYAWKVIKSQKADEAFFITLMQVVSLLPFLLPRKTKISGIIYSVEGVCNYKRYGVIRRWIEQIRFRIIASKVKNAYILNDREWAEKLNRLFKTKAFKFLPDPIPENAFNPYLASVDFLNINGEIVFLHFGYMKERKGTLDILRAINLLPKDFNATFIFAGIVDQEIKKEFYELIEINKSRDIKVIDRYCDYDFFNDLCYISDCILLPYHAVNQSSGVIGYAAVHHIPVIGPTVGLLGSLIRSYSLGETLQIISPTEIAKALQGFKKYKTESNYAETNSTEIFIKTII